MPGKTSGSLQNFFNAMPEHRRSITKDGINFFSLIIFKRINIFTLQTRRANLREVNTYGETNPPFIISSSCILPLMIHRSSVRTNIEFLLKHVNNLDQIHALLLTPMAK